jgi:dTDP-4-amino-4,6-dideoxygalactose transaminase
MIRVFDLDRKILRYQDVIEARFREVLKSGQLILGLEVKNFESKFAKYLGVDNCVGVGNGTDALYLSLRALNVTSETTVGLVANAGYYTSTAINAVGARKKYLDVDPKNSNVTLETIKNTQNLDVLVVTHLYGLAVENMEQVSEYCRANGIHLVEDCAQAAGAIVDGKKVGSWGDLATFSFYPTKNLGALGDGGAVVGNSDVLINRVRKLREYGWSEKYSVELRGGVNSRLDEIQAAFLATFLDYLDDENSKRRQIANEYSSKIQNSLIATPDLHSEEFVAHLYVIQCAKRDLLAKYLHENGVSTAIHYPINDYSQQIEINNDEFRLGSTDSLGSRILTIPCHPELGQDEIDRIIQLLNDFKLS